MAINDLGWLITLNIALTLIGLSIAVIGVWAVIHEMGKNTREIMATGERIARIAERIDARLRRDFPNIGDEFAD